MVGCEHGIRRQRNLESDPFARISILEGLPCITVIVVVKKSSIEHRHWTADVEFRSKKLIYRSGD
jgi:hypothetical protein